MEYTSKAPWAQLSWDIGPVTLSAGARREDGELHVDSYTTTAFRNSVFVEGGTLDYKENLFNAGLIWRIAGGWSAFASYGEGFTLPNVGIPLRNISVPGQSVAGILDLQAIVVENKEVGFNWRGDFGGFGGSYSDSRSDFGQSLSIDPTTNDFVLLRAPTRIKGYELSGDFRFSDAWRLNAVYSHTRGKTAFWGADVRGRYGAGELNRPMGVNDISPDKFAWTLVWNFVPQGEITLGATTLFDRDLSGRDVRAFDNTAFTFEEHTNGYTLFDLGATYEFERFGRLALGIENLLDKQYILSWSQPPGGFQPPGHSLDQQAAVGQASHIVIVSPMHQGGLITLALLQATQLQHDHRTPLPVQAHGTALHRKQAAVMATALLTLRRPINRRQVIQNGLSTRQRVTPLRRRFR